MARITSVERRIAAVEDYNRSEPGATNVRRTSTPAPQLTAAHGMLVRRVGRADEGSTEDAVAALQAQVKRLLAWKAQSGATLA